MSERAIQQVHKKGTKGSCHDTEFEERSLLPEKMKEGIIGEVGMKADKQEFDSQSWNNWRSSMNNNSAKRKRCILGCQDNVS